MHCKSCVVLQKVGIVYCLLKYISTAEFTHVHKTDTMDTDMTVDINTGFVHIHGHVGACSCACSFACACAYACACPSLPVSQFKNIHIHV
jgi:hypothetical protein